MHSGARNAEYLPASQILHGKIPVGNGLGKRVGTTLMVGTGVGTDGIGVLDGKGDGSNVGRAEGSADGRSDGGD